jgi:hypothetical protein
MKDVHVTTMMHIAGSDRYDNPQPHKLVRDVIIWNFQTFFRYMGRAKNNIEGI